MSRRQLAYAAVAITLVMGLLGLLNPALTARILGLEVMDPRGFSQVRATFGAMYLALAGVIAWAVSAKGSHPAYLRVPALLIGALALGRLMSIIIDGVVTPLNLLFFVTEAASAAVVMLASFERVEGPGGSTGTPDVPTAGRAV